MNSKKSAVDEKKFSLENFFPYQLSMLSRRLGDALETYYGPRHGLNRSQWRILSLIGQNPGCTAVDLVRKASLDAVAIHRAVSQLLEAGLVERQVVSSDRRAKSLQLSERGHQVYEDIVPMAMKFEESLLAQLPSDECAALLRAVKKLASLPGEALQIESSASCNPLKA